MITVKEINEVISKLNRARFILQIIQENYYKFDSTMVIEKIGQDLNEVKALIDLKVTAPTQGV